MDAPTSSLHGLSDAAAESEFRNELKQSVKRAFEEGHSIDNAAVELKTLRMASNGNLRTVREVVIEAIVEEIGIIEGDAQGQRKAIAEVVDRWGPLVDRIGGIDHEETIEILQVRKRFPMRGTEHILTYCLISAFQYHCARSSRLALFGQILATFYQEDLVDEDDIRAWHAKPAARGEGHVHKHGASLEGIKHCWNVGGKMIEQFNAQESSEEESDEESDDE